MNEAKEELKKENLEIILRKYGKHIVILVALAVISMAALSWYKGHKEALRVENGDKYSEALRLSTRGKTDDALSIFSDLSEKGQNGYKQTASFKKAEILANQGKYKEAAEVYDAVTKDNAADGAIRELASLYAASVLIEHFPDDESIGGRLDKLTAGGNIWRFSAQELAGIYHLKKGDKTKAAEIFTVLSSDISTPPMLRDRAEKIVSILKSNS